MPTLAVDASRPELTRGRHRALAKHVNPALRGTQNDVEGAPNLLCEGFVCAAQLAAAHLIRGCSTDTPRDKPQGLEPSKLHYAPRARRGKQTPKEKALCVTRPFPSANISAFLSLPDLRVHAEMVPSCLLSPVSLPPGAAPTDEAQHRCPTQQHTAVLSCCWPNSDLALSHERW